MVEIEEDRIRVNGSVNKIFNFIAEPRRNFSHIEEVLDNTMINSTPTLMDIVNDKVFLHDC